MHRIGCYLLREGIRIDYYPSGIVPWGNFEHFAGAMGIENSSRYGKNAMAEMLFVFPELLAASGKIEEHLPEMVT